MDAVVGIAQESGFAGLIADWRYLVMIVIACVPVSYTHLDVYKRQARRSVSRWNC